MYAYVICGPESSGNRYLYRLLCTTGLHPCHGVPLSFATTTFLDPPAPCVVVRTLPHAESWSKLGETVYYLLQQKYQPFLLFPVRDPRIVELSQVANGHVPDHATARVHLQRAWNVFLDVVDDAYRPLDYLIFPYQSLQSPEFLLYLRVYCSLPQIPDLLSCPFEDGDAKYHPTFPGSTTP